MEPEAIGPTGAHRPHRGAHPHGHRRSGASSYFKFDFLAWLDCVGPAVDMYDYREAFVAMLDRLIADHPASRSRSTRPTTTGCSRSSRSRAGPSWFQNGSPDADRAAAQPLEPEPVRAGVLARASTCSAAARATRYPVDDLMAVALAVAHDVLQRPAPRSRRAVVDAAAPWTGLQAHRAALPGVTYPLLEDPLGRRLDRAAALGPGGGPRRCSSSGRTPDTTRSVALRNVPPGKTFALYSAPDDAPLGTRTSAELSAGITVEASPRSTPRRSSASSRP